MQNRGDEMHLVPPGKVFWTFLKHVLSDRYKIWQRANIVLSGPKSIFFDPTPSEVREIHVRNLNFLIYL